MDEFVKRTLNREDHAKVDRQAAILRGIIHILFSAAAILGWVLYLVK